MPDRLGQGAASEPQMKQSDQNLETRIHSERVAEKVKRRMQVGGVPIHEATLNLNSIRNILRDARFTEDEVDELTDPISKCLEVLR